ncbi:hypothetical protein diail_309 [Diaporthe ilicicola]|nr:hypothetical protein diail_309 [Diaporthe ilicicola]
MLPVPSASPSRGGSPSTTQSTSPSDERETTDSTFSEIQVEVKVGDNGDIEVKSPVLDSMQRAAHNTPLPNGNGGDGGSGSDRPSPTPIRTRPEPYYSNEDITILHEIVSNGEEILDSLPERERLPTNALFMAADTILPKYGYDSEDVPHISRLLFRIGAERSEESLVEKFRSLLASMGIEVVYTDDSMSSTAEEGDDAEFSAGDQSAGGPTPRPHIIQRDQSSPLHPGLALSVPPQDRFSSPSPMHYAPRRRRNSDSIALSFVAPGNESLSAEPPIRHARAHSTAGETPDLNKKGVRFSDVVETQSISERSWDQNASGPSTIENIPYRPKPGTIAEPDASSNGLNGSAQFRPPGSGQDLDERPSTRAENRAPPDFSNFGQHARVSEGQAGNHLPNGVFSDADVSSSLDLVGDEADYVEEPSLPEHPPEYEEGHDTRETERIDEEYNDLRHDEYSVKLPFRDAVDEADMSKAQVNYLMSREQMFRMSSFNHWARIARQTKTRNIELEANAEVWDAWGTMGDALEVWIETALTMHIDENDGLRAYQEHMREMEGLERNRESTERVAGEAAAVPAVLPGESIQPRVRESIERSRSSAAPSRAVSDLKDADREAMGKSPSVERTFVEELPYRPAPAPDRRFQEFQAQQMQSFSSEWDPNLGSRQGSFYDAPEEREEEAWLDSDLSLRSQYHIAAAAWDYFILSKAFTHWANRAEEEVQRTQVARRHILRKKCFSAWLEEGDKEESESESKAVWFSQLVAMRDWQDISQAQLGKHRRLQTLAIRRHRRDLAEGALIVWYQESKLRLATAIDHARLRSACFHHWQGESGWLSSAHEEAEGIFRGSMLGRYMRDWKTSARVQERAEDGAGPIIVRRDEFLRSGLSLAWRQEAEECKGREKVAILQDLKEHAKHWMYETRLRAWQEQQDAEALDRTTYHWYCEWRLILCKRVTERQDRARFCEKWTDSARQSHTNSRNMRHLAREVRYHDSITGFFNASIDAIEQLEEGAMHARGMILQRVVPKTIEQWSSQLEPVNRLENWSRLGRFYSISDSVLKHWRDVRRQEWQRRMRKLYKDFRYRVRCDTLRESLDSWRQKSADVVTSGWEADDIRAEDDGGVIFDVAQAWREKHEYYTFSAEVAEDADKEAHLILWHSLVEAEEESRLDAAEYDFAQTASQYWEAWELASVSLRGRDRAAHEFMGHNARRDRRHFVGVWASQTSGVGPGGDRVPELGGMMDFRATRRNSRWNTPAAANDGRRSRMVTDYTPFRTPARPSFTPARPSFLSRVTSTTPAYKPPSELTFEEEEEGLVA